MSSVTPQSNVITDEAPTLSPLASASPVDLDKQHVGQSLTSNPVAVFMASLFEIPRSEMCMLDAGTGAGVLSAGLIGRLRREPRKAKRVFIK